MMTTVHSPLDVRIFYKESESLVKAGFDVSVVVPHQKDEVVRGVRFKAIAKPKGRLSRMVKSGWRAYREAVKLNADVYHFHDPELIPIGLLLRFKGRPVIYDIHEDLPRDIQAKQYIPAWARRPLAWGVERFENFSCSRFTALVAATNAIGRRFMHFHRRTVTVRNYPIVEEGEIKDSVPYDSRENEILFIGGITLSRGVKEMVKAMSFLPATLGARLKLIGSFVPPGLRNELESLPGWDRTEANGFVDRAIMWKSLVKARAGLVVPHPDANNREAEPNKLFEYMSAGLPVVAADFPLWRTIIEDLGCGLLVNPLDPTEIGRAIEYILTHSKEADEMGRRGQKAVREKLNWKHEERILLNLYDSIE